MPEKSLKSKKSSVAKKQPPEVEAEACIFINKETLTQVFSCEFSEILPENLWVTASGGAFFPHNILTWKGSL